MKTLHRILLEKLLKQNAHLITGKVLDAGSGKRRYDHFFKGEIIACDLNPKPELKVEKCDICFLQYPNEYFDSVLCLEVLEYLEPQDIKKALSELGRVLKKNGKVFISLPFYYKDHGDKTRLSLGCFHEALSGCGFSEIDIKKIGNKFTAYHDIMRYGFMRAKFLKPLYFLEMFLSKIAIKAFGLDKIKDDFYSGFFAIVKK